MTDFQIFGLQVVLSLVAYGVIAKYSLWPRLRAMTLRDALVLLLIFHIFRHLGALMLVTVVVDPALPRSFANQVTYGDLLAQVLAYVGLIALWGRWRSAIALVWFFNVVGTLDFFNAFFQGMRLNVTQYHLGPAWLIPTFAVPFLLVAHYLTFVVLVKRGKEPLT